MKNSTEIELLIKLRHPDPYMNWHGFIDSLPDLVIKAQWRERPATTIRIRRYLIKQFLGTEIDVRDFLKSLQEYYEKQH